MGTTIDSTFEPKRMNEEEIVDTLKTMVFGAQAFKRFNAKEREALDKAIDTICKYQKMQEILEKVWNVPSCMIDKAECLDKVMETYRTMRCDSSKNDYKNRIIDIDLNHADE